MKALLARNAVPRLAARPALRPVVASCDADALAVGSAARASRTGPTDG